MASTLYLGQTVEDGSLIELPVSTLARHMVVLGASGSGKTVACKAIVEEAVRNRIPVIAIDPQGDIASLALRGESERMRRAGVSFGISEDYWKNVDVKIWTPGSNMGLPISLAPNLCFDELEGEPKQRIMTNAAKAMSAMCGFGGKSEDAAVAAFCTIFEYADRYRIAIDGLSDFMAILNDPPGQLLHELDPLFSERDRAAAIKHLLVKMRGPQRMMLNGIPIHVDTLFGYDEGGAYDQGKTRVSVIYLNTLMDQEDKDIFVASLANAIYSWMLQKPADHPVGLVYLDEAAPYMPPVRKPITKEPLSLLMRQARKYGVSMLVATQSPGDLDYKALGQVGTRLLGRMSTHQEAAKILPYLSAAEQEEFEGIMEHLASLPTGQFVLSSPDVYPGPVMMKVRWLVSDHRTLEPEVLESLVSPADRKRYSLQG